MRGIITKNCCGILLLVLCVPVKAGIVTPNEVFIQQLTDSVEQTLKIASLINQAANSFPADIRNFVKPTTNIVINVSGLVEATINLVTTDFSRMMAHMDCVIKNDKVLIDMAKDKKPSKKTDKTDLSCPGIGCISTRACLAQSAKEAVRVLRPFITNILGEAGFDEKTKDTKMTKGLLLNLDDVSLVAFDKVSKLMKNNKNMTDILEKLSKFVEDARKVETNLSVVLSTMLGVFDIVAMVIGGPDYVNSLPPVEKEEAKEMLTEVVEAKEMDIVFDDEFKKEVKEANK